MAESYSVEAVLSAKDSGFTSAMRNAKNSVSSLGKITSGLKFGALMAAGGKTFTTLASGAKGFVSELNASQATWKTFESNMKNFGKSSQTIKKVKGDLQNFATKSIYSASDMASTYSQLSAVGTKNTTDLVKAFGGLAAAAENPQQAMKTLSQQATQMAAKPKVQWMDFKLMLEQTPAGIAQVAKAMGKSTEQLVKDVQDGKVKTEDFFKAMRKAGGEGTALNKMATQYKTMGQAIDGVKESLTTKLQPAFDVVSDYGIKAIGKFEGVLGKIDGNKIAKVLSTGLSKASSVASKVFSKIAPVAASAGKTLYNFGKAVFDVGRSITTNKTAVDGFKTALSTLGNGVTKVSGFLSKHSETIGKVAPIIAAAVAGYMGLNKATSILGNVGAKSATTGLSGISTALNNLNPTGVLALAGSVATFVAALGAMSAMRGMIIPFLSGLVGVFGQVMEVIRANTDVIIALVDGALNALANALVTVAPAMQPIASAFASLSPLITAVGDAIATVLPALGPVVTALGKAISTVVTAVGKAVSGIAKALTPIVKIVANAIVSIVKALAPYTPEITKMVQATMTAVTAVAGAFNTLFSNLSSIFNSIANVIRTFATGVVAVITAFANGACQIMTTFGNTISQILTSAGNFFTTFANAVSTVLQSFSTSVSTVLTSVGTLFTNFGTAVSTVMNSVSGIVTAVGGAISGVLDSIAGIFDSMGTAALNAGKGVKLLASGIKSLVGLSLADLAGTLTAVSIGLGKMASSGAGVAKAGSAIGKIANACKTAAAGLAKLNSASSKANSSLTRLISSAQTAANKLASAGKSGGNNFANGISSGMQKASSKTTSSLNSINQKMTSAANRIRTAGKTAGTGFSTGLSSGLTKAVSKTTSTCNSIVNKLKAAATKAKTTGTNAGKGFTNGLKSGMSQAPNVATSTVNSVASRIRAGYGAAYSSGKKIGNGVAAGLRSALGAVRSAANAIVAQAERAARAKAKIHSPSRLMAKEVGRPLALGIAQGMFYETASVKKAASSLIQSVARTQTKEAGRQLKKTASKTEGQYSKTWEGVSKNLTAAISKAQTSALKKGQTDLNANAGKFFKTTALEKRIESNKDLIAAEKERLEEMKASNKTASAALKSATAERDKLLKASQKERKANIKAIKADTAAESKQLKARIKALESAAKKTKDAGKKASYNKQIKALKSQLTTQEKMMWANINEVKAQGKAQEAAVHARYKDAIKELADQKKLSSKQMVSLQKSTKATAKENTRLNRILKENKKKAEALYKAAYAQYEKYIKDETIKATKAIDSQISAITSKYQALYDTIASQRNTFLSNLKDYGSLYEADQYGYVAFKDWNKSIKEMTTLQANLKRLQKAGVSQGFLSEITSMSTTEALTYTNALLKKGTKFAKSQSNSYDTMMKKASQISSNIYQPYVDAVDKAYNKDLTKALKSLDKKLEKIGQDAAAALARGLQSAAIKLGVTTQTGMAKGVKKGTTKSTKATAKAAGKSTTAAKKKLKVHSPSRVFAQIGEMTGAGFVRGIDSMCRRISTATMDMIRIPRAESPRLAYAGDTRLSDNYTYGGSRYEITVVSEIDGREFARATVDPMSEELERKNRNSSRNRGRRT